MANGRCRIHGGKSIDPKMQESIERIRKAHWKHRLRSAEAVRRRKESVALRRKIKRLADWAKSFNHVGSVTSVLRITTSCSTLTDPAGYASIATVDSSTRRSERSSNFGGEK
jgi:hypothetical protein